MPINRAKAIIDDLTHGRNVAYSFLGIEQVSPPDLAKELNEDTTREEIFGGGEGENAKESDEGGRSGGGGSKSNSKENSFLPEIFGSLVMKVQPGSAAAAAGLQRGDVICGFRVLDGVRTGDGTVGSVEDLAVAVDATPVGGRIALQVQRGRDRPPHEVMGTAKDLAQVEYRGHCRPTPDIPAGNEPGCVLCAVFSLSVLAVLAKIAGAPVAKRKRALSGGRWRGGGGGRQVGCED